MKYTYEQELQANEFAMALLMPERQFREQCKLNESEDGSTINMTKVAEYFKVTVGLACLRGEKLGLIKGAFD